MARLCALGESIPRSLTMVASSAPVLSGPGRRCWHAIRSRTRSSLRRSQPSATLPARREQRPADRGAHGLAGVRVRGAGRQRHHRGSHLAGHVVVLASNLRPLARVQLVLAVQARLRKGLDPTHLRRELVERLVRCDAPPTLPAARGLAAPPVAHHPVPLVAALGTLRHPGVIHNLPQHFYCWVRQSAAADTYHPLRRYKAPLFARSPCGQVLDAASETSKVTNTHSW